ncbi:MAG: phenylalanine--tRNA ligase subunit beta [Candidatus Wolfebacteria bacterium]|nr:phenylalanine--tRNA ligase subunit beta [Candidatus Wolfebacteria bacterium]
MKFSYTLLKQLVPAIKGKKELIEKLDFYLFEAEDMGGDVLNIEVQPNRFSDAASHWGLAREISAIYGKKFPIPQPKNSIAKNKNLFRVSVKNKNFCPRYRAQYFDNVRVNESPQWMRKILMDCGLRPINGIVDIMNYVMLETGQPLHAFDYDKVKNITVRLAKKGEKIKTLDNKDYVLNESTLVIADDKKPIAIAGVKGGKDAEIDKNTTKIIVEAANFDGANIYKTSGFLGLKTDASIRFSHNINPELTALGLNRAAELLKGVAGAKAGEICDVNSVKPGKKLIKINLGKISSLIGVDFDFKTIKNNLDVLGFGIKIPAKGMSRYPAPEFLVEPPYLRQDIETWEDVAEEVGRIYGLNRVKSAPPKISLSPSGFEDKIVLKDKIRRVLVGFGLSEIYNYAFIGDKELSLSSVWKDEVIELENPISNQAKYLRPSLAAHLLKNIESNFRFFGSFKIFEIGNIFWKEDGKYREQTKLGMVFASEKKELFFELKGAISELFKKIGLVDYFMPEINGKGDWLSGFTDNYLEKDGTVQIESSGRVFGYLGKVKNNAVSGSAAMAEIDLDELLKLVVEEHEYLPLPKYPSVMRDVSVAVSDFTRVGDIMQAIQAANEKCIDDVDLIDEYKDSYTFRIVFQANDRTLTDEEVNKEMAKIEKLLQNRFRATIR